MNKIIDIVSEMKSLNFGGQLIKIALGFTFFFILVNLRYFGLAFEFPFLEFDSIGYLVAVLLFSYVVAELLNIIAEIIFNTYYFIIKNYNKNVAELLKKFFKLPGTVYFTPEMKKEISYSEILNYSGKNPVLTMYFEQLRNKGLLLKLFFSITLCFIFLISWLFLWPTIILFLFNIKYEQKLASARVDIGVALVKSQDDAIKPT